MCTDMDEEKSPVNGSVSNWTHENLRAQSNVDKGRWFIVVLIQQIMIFALAVLLTFVK